MERPANRRSIPFFAGSLCCVSGQILKKPHAKTLSGMDNLKGQRDFCDVDTMSEVVEVDRVAHSHYRGNRAEIHAIYA